MPFGLLDHTNDFTDGGHSPAGHHRIEDKRTQTQDLTHLISPPSLQSKPQTHCKNTDRHDTYDQ